MIKGVVILWVLLMPGVIMAQCSETGFLNRSVDYQGTDRLYQVYVPRQYTASSEWPVVLFLHGSGERGDDGLKQTQVGLGGAIRYDPERWPAIVVFPQKTRHSVKFDRLHDNTPEAFGNSMLNASVADCKRPRYIQKDS